MNTEPNNTAPTPIPSAIGKIDHEAKTYFLSPQEEILVEHSKKLLQNLKEDPSRLFQFPQQPPPPDAFDGARDFRETHSWLISKNPKKRRRIIKQAGQFLQVYLQHQADTLIASLLKEKAHPFKEEAPDGLPQKAAQYFLICIRPEYKKLFMIVTSANLSPEDRYTVRMENDRLTAERKEFQEKLLKEQQEKFAQSEEGKAANIVGSIQTPDGEQEISQLQLERMQQMGMIPPPNHLQPEDEGYQEPSKIIDPSTNKPITPGSDDPKIIPSDGN